jgi:hypothetical protein
MQLGIFRNVTTLSKMMPLWTLTQMIFKAETSPVRLVQEQKPGVIVQYVSIIEPRIDGMTNLLEGTYLQALSTKGHHMRASIIKAFQ